MSLWRRIAHRVGQSRLSGKSSAQRIAAMEGLEPRAMFTAAPASFAGVTVNGDMTATKLIPILKKLHVKEVRLFFSFSDWSKHSGNTSIKQAQQYHAAGLKVMMEVENARVPSYSEALSFFKYVAGRKDALAAVDLWEIGNEPNRPPFWQGTASQYVNTILKAAWTALHPKGEKIVGAGPTFDLGYCQALVDAGYLKYLDYANFHPYGHSVDQVIDHMTRSLQVYKGKPVIFSEWNIRDATSTSDWQSKLNQIAARGSRIAAFAFYYCLVKSNTWAGPAGLLTTDGADNAGYSKMFQKWFE